MGIQSEGCLGDIIWVSETMTEVMSGPAPYIYVSTRMRVRKAKLIPREEYLRMLNMGLPEFTRLIEEMEYKREIDELSASLSGVDLI